MFGFDGFSVLPALASIDPVLAERFEVHVRPDVVAGRFVVCPAAGVAGFATVAVCGLSAALQVAWSAVEQLRWDGATFNQMLAAAA